MHGRSGEVSQLHDNTRLDDQEEQQTPSLIKFAYWISLIQLTIGCIVTTAAHVPEIGQHVSAMMRSTLFSFLMFSLLFSLTLCCTAQLHSWAGKLRRKATVIGVILAILSGGNFIIVGSLIG